MRGDGGSRDSIGGGSKCLDFGIFDVRISRDFWCIICVIGKKS